MSYWFIITILILGMVYGLCLVLCYRLGIKDGLTVAQGQKPEPIKGPVTVLKEYREAKGEQKQADEITQGLANLLNYNGDPQEGGGR